MKQQLLVSVIMPVHNAGRFLVAAIESILHQTYPHFELIIVDDVSTDMSWGLIKKYKREYPKKIKIFRMKKQTNAAGNAAMNEGLTHAKGELIARMDADDVALPKRLEKQVQFMQKYPRTILVGTQATVIDKYGKTVGKKVVPVDHERIYEQFGVYHPIIHPSVMIRRNMLPDPTKLYPLKWDVNDDYFAFFKLLNYGMFANLPEVLMKYRMHGENFSLQHPKQKFLNSVKIRLEAIRKLNYRMSPLALAFTLAQLMFVPLIPERLIIPAYMILRGIKSPQLKSRRFFSQKKLSSMRRLSLKYL